MKGENLRINNLTNSQLQANIFMILEDNDEEKAGKKKYNELWDQLSTHLNTLGPPTHSTSEWRRVWSKYKYSKSKQSEQSNTLLGSTLSRTGNSECYLPVRYESI